MEDNDGLYRFTIDLDDNGQFMDATFYFDDGIYPSGEPYSVREFVPGSLTRIKLETLIEGIKGLLDPT